MWPVIWFAVLKKLSAWSKRDFFGIVHVRKTYREIVCDFTRSEMVIVLNSRGKEGNVESQMFSLRTSWRPNIFVFKKDD